MTDTSNSQQAWTGAELSHAVWWIENKRMDIGHARLAFHFFLFKLDIQLVRVHFDLNAS